MFDKDTPLLNTELLNWLVTYKLRTGEKKSFTTIYKEIINFIKIEPLVFINIVNKLIERGYVADFRKEIYKEKSKNILELIGYETFLSLTKEGKKQLLFGWELAISVIPQELYEEFLKSICSISESKC